MSTTEKVNPFQWYRHGDLTDAGNAYRTLATAPALVTDGISVPPSARGRPAALRITHDPAGGGKQWFFYISVYGYRPQVLIETPVGTFTAIAGATGPGWSELARIAVDGGGFMTLAEDHALDAITGYERLAAQEYYTPSGDPDIWTDFGFSTTDEEL